MELIDRIQEILKDKDKKGISFIGDNSKGKTYIMEECVENLKEKYKVIYIPENCQNLNIRDHNENIISNLNGIKTKAELRRLSRVYADRIPEKRGDSGNIQKAQEEDLESTIISQLLAENTPEELIKFFEEKLNFRLDLTKVPMEISIANENFSKLTSSGYKAMIRIAAEIYFYLFENKDKQENLLIFIDEIDAKFYWKNRQKYFRYLEAFIRDTFNQKNIYFIISSHMSETIANLSEGYSIMKVLETKDGSIKYKEYQSNDFLNQEQVDRIIFDKNTEIFKESENLDELKKLYFILLKSNINFKYVKKNTIFFSDMYIFYNEQSNHFCISKNTQPDKIDVDININSKKNYNLIYYSKLSLKEKIIFNSIKQLLGWR